MFWLLKKIFLIKSNLLDGINLNVIFSSAIILFSIGLKDDLVGVSPSKKFIAQLLSGLIIIYFGDYKINNLNPGDELDLIIN